MDFEKELLYDDVGDRVLEEPDTDPLDHARHVFKNGRLEFMGGPVYSEQGHNTTEEVMNMETFQMEKVPMENNKVKCNYAYPMGSKTDPVAHDLGVSETQQ